MIDFFHASIASKLATDKPTGSHAARRPISCHQCSHFPFILDECICGITILKITQFRPIGPYTHPRVWQLYRRLLNYFLNLSGHFLGRVHTTALGPERFRNATGRPCSHLFHCVRSFRNEPTTSRCDRSGTVPERVRLALWCERATAPVPEPFQLPVTFVDSQPILHISKRSSLHGILPQIV